MQSPPRPRSPETAPGRSSRLGVGLACVLLALVFGKGCASPTHPPSTPYVPQSAIVSVENHTDWSWRIAFVHTDSPSASPTSSIGLPWITVEPREIRRVDLSGGIYRVKCELQREAPDAVAATAPAEEAQSEACLWLVPGRTYTWPLATLFSTEEGSQ